MSKPTAANAIIIPAPTIGRVVHLQLSEQDAAHAMAQRELDGRRAGNTLEAGQTYPAIIVRVFDGSPAVNLQVLLDGNDSLWVTSRIEGDQPGQWSWPTRS